MGILEGLERPLLPAPRSAVFGYATRTAYTHAPTPDRLPHQIVAETTDKMVWTEADSEGTWTDEFDGAERVFYDMSQAFKGRHHREHGSVYAFCRIRCTLPPTSTGLGALGEKLRQAWTRLRFDYPALTVFEAGGKKTYLAATATNIETWVNDTFWVDNAAGSAPQVAAGLHLRRLPCLVFVPQSSEVLLHSSHWRLDALGACMVLDRLLSILAELAGSTTPGSLEAPRWEEEPEHLPPSLEDAYECASVPTPITEAKAEEIRRRNFETAYPTAGMPHRGDQTTPPALSRCRTLALGKHPSEQLIRACKVRGFSVTAAVHAACAASVFDCCAAADGEESCHSSYSTIVSVNLRPFLPPAGKGGRGEPDSRYACGTYVTGITHTLRRGDGFVAWCRQLTRGYRGDWDPPAYLDALRSIYRVHGEALAGLAGGTSPPRPPASNVTVSSLGVLDDRYLRADYGDGAVQVDAFHLGSAIMGRQPTLYVWTFRGCLTLSVDYNEAYYSAFQIAALLDSIVTCLSQELEVDMSAASE